jgi:hypothetical protein
VFRDPVSGHCLDLAAVEGIGLVGAASHQSTFTSSGVSVITRRPSGSVSGKAGPASSALGSQMVRTISYGC